MKLILLLSLFCLSYSNATQAQTFAEWFKQKKTQIKYLVNQIAAYKVYIEDAEKGYAIVQKGTGVIGDIKKGEFNLHSDYFSSLKGVSPAVKTYVRVGDIIALQVRMVKAYHDCYAGVQNGNTFSKDEVTAVYDVFTNLLTESSATIDVLISLTTAGKMEMTDEERMRRIDGLYKSMSGMFAFSQEFCESTAQLALQREKEQFDVNTLRSFYGIK